MNLKQFIQQKRGRSSELSKALSISPSYLSQMISGTSPIPIKTAVLIENFSCGQVSRKEMFPDDWHHIWPELLAEKSEMDICARIELASSERSPATDGLHKVLEEM